MKYGKSKRGCVKKYHEAGIVNELMNPKDPLGIKAMFSYFKEAECPKGSIWSEEEQKCIPTDVIVTRPEITIPQEFANMDIDAFASQNLIQQNQEDQTYAQNPGFQQKYDSSLLEYHQNNPNNPNSNKYGSWYQNKYPTNQNQQVPQNDNFAAIMFGVGTSFATALAEKSRRKRQGQYYMNNLANPYKGLLAYNDGLSDSSKYGLVNAKMGGLLSKRQDGGEENEEDDEDFIDYLYGDESQTAPQTNPYSQLTELGAPDISQYKDKIAFQKDLNIWMSTQQSAGATNDIAIRRARNTDMANSINNYEEDVTQYSLDLLGDSPATESYDLSQIKVKGKNVNLTNLNPGLAASVNKLSTLFPGLVVTSGNDQGHTRKSAHYDDDAIDIGANSSDKKAYQELKKFLPQLSKIHGFKFLDEGDHIHISKSRLGKLKNGGKVRDNKGYLSSNAANFTDKKIIDSNHITTDGMAFPILANGIPLYPNTGDFFIPGNEVTEYPMYQKSEFINKKNKNEIDMSKYRGKSKKKGMHKMPDGTMMSNKEMQSGGIYMDKPNVDNYGYPIPTRNQYMSDPEFYGEAPNRTILNKYSSMVNNGTNQPVPDSQYGKLLNNLSYMKNNIWTESNVYRPENMHIAANYDQIYKNQPSDFAKRGGVINPYQEGGMAPQETPQQGGDQMQQIAAQVSQALQQGAPPEKVMQQLIEMGIPSDQAVAIIQSVMQQSQQAAQMRMGGRYKKTK